MVREKVVKTVVKVFFFLIGKTHLEFNKTLIVLILKKIDAKSLKEFRSTSLCNMIYKIVTNLLVKMLQPHLDKLINLA